MRQKPRPPADPRLAGLFASRGRLHAYRYLRTRDSHDLEDAISTMRTAVALAKKTQSDVLGSALGNLAGLLLEQAKSKESDAVLNEALQLATWALDCLSHRDPDHVLVLATLGSILASQYDRFGRVQDLEGAISSLESATLAQTPTCLGDGAFPAVVSSNLSCVLGKRYESTGRREDLKDAITSALTATEMESSNYPQMMAGMGSNLASLLARQYQFTGALESLANALFELRIVTEVAPESPELDVLLGHLSTLAKGQHELRAQPTAEDRVSQLTHSRPLTLFVLLSLSPVLSVVYPPAIYPLILFLGGIACNWAVRGYQRRTSSGGGPVYLLHSAPTWAKKLLSLPDNSSRFAPTLFSIPWIDAPTTSTWTRDEELFTGDQLWRQKSTRSTHFEGGYDQEDNKISRASLSQPISISASPQKALNYELVTNSQKQKLNDHLRDTGVLDDIDDFDEPPRNLGAPSQGSVDEDEIIEPKEAEKCVSHIPTTQVLRVEDVNNTEIPHFMETSRVPRRTKIIADEVPTSKQPVARTPTLASKPDSKLAPTKKGLPSSKDQEEISKPQDKPSPTALNPVDANIETPEKSGTTPPPREENESIEDAHSNLGKDFIDQKVHSRNPPTKIDKETTAFESVAQGHTENDINKNEGNAMGNIYSEEANVVGHLTRHYGDRFETKNISAVLRGYQDPEANQSLRDNISDYLPTQHIPQQVVSGYNRSLDQRPERERPDKSQESLYRDTRHGRADHPGGRSPGAQLGEPDIGSSDFEENEWSSFPLPGEPTRFARKHRPGSLRARNGFPGSSPTRQKASRGVLPAPAGSLLSYGSDAKPRVRRSATTGHRRRSALPPHHSEYSDESAGNDSGSDGSYSLSSLEFPLPRSIHPPPERPRSRRSIYEQMPNTKTLKARDSFEEADYKYSKQEETAREYVIRSGGFYPPSPEDPTRSKTTTRIRRSPVRASPSHPPAPDLRRYRTPYEQLRALSTYYSDHLRPLCTEFVSNIPQDSKTRDVEYKRLSEMILQQIILNADGIEANGDEHTRTARRTLVKQAHAALNQLDEAVLGSK